jgi:hypothetical protein
VSVTYTVAKGTGLATIVSTSASKSHGIALMGRTVAEKILCVQKIPRYRKNGFTEEGLAEFNKPAELTAA